MRSTVTVVSNLPISFSAAWSHLRWEDTVDMVRKNCSEGQNSRITSTNSIALNHHQDLYRTKVANGSTFAFSVYIFWFFNCGIVQVSSWALPQHCGLLCVSSHGENNIFVVYVYDYYTLFISQLSRNSLSILEGRCLIWLECCKK